MTQPDTAKATERPWRVTIDERGETIRATDSSGRPIASMWLNGDDARANAALIVAAVNSYNPSRDSLLKQMAEALRTVNKLVSEAAMTGFNCRDGDWADRLFESQQATSRAIKDYEQSEAGR